MMQYSLFSDDDFAKPNPFQDRVVCILGTFRQSSKVLSQRFSDLGADCRTSTKISRNVHYVLMGEGVSLDQTESLRQLLFNGYAPRLLSQSDIDDIFQGHYSQYVVPVEIKKDLHLTLQHYLQFRLQYESDINPLYTRELFVAPDTKVAQEELFQMLGNRGAYANAYLDDTTDVIVISDSSVQHLREGVSDDVLRLVENTYNSSKSQNYHYVMTSESELLAWLNGSSANF